MGRAVFLQPSAISQVRVNFTINNRFKTTGSTMEETTLDQMEMESGSIRRRRRVSTLLLGGRPLDLQLSKHDIIVILLRSIGPANVSSTVVDDVFEQIDEDKNGYITGEELSNFLQAKEH
eukprot:scaffold290_cov172-Skeletonema_marinoi.AAC.2